jgi:hypothetical protein
VGTTGSRRASARPLKSIIAVTELDSHGIGGERAPLVALDQDTITLATSPGTGGGRQHIAPLVKKGA